MSCCRVGVVERLGWRAGCKIYSSWRFGFLGQNSSSPVATFPLNHPLNLLSSLQLFPSVACASLNTQTLPCKSSRISRLGNSLVGNAWVCLGFVVAPVEHTRPSYRLPNPTAWQRWGWCRSMPLRPTGCEAERVLPASTRTPIHQVCTHTEPATQINTLSTHTNTNSTHGLTRLPALTRALVHPLQLLPSWTHRPPSPGPTPGAARRAPDTHTRTRTHKTVLLPGESWQWSLVRRQDRLPWPGTGHGQPRVAISPLLRGGKPFSSHYSSISHACSSSNHLDTFFSSTKLARNKQLGNALTIHLVMGPKPLDNALLPLPRCTRCFGAPVHSSWQAVELSLPWDSLGGTRAGACVSLTGLLRFPHPASRLRAPSRVRAYGCACARA